MFDRTARLVRKCRGATMLWAQIVAPVRPCTRQRAVARKAGGREASGPLATSGDDLPELFDSTEDSINQIARRVQRMVERPSLRTSAPEGEDGRRSEVGETVENGVGVVGPVRDHRQAGFDVYRQRLGTVSAEVQSAARSGDRIRNLCCPFQSTSARMPVPNACRLRPSWENSPRASDPVASRCRRTAGTLPPVGQRLVHVAPLLLRHVMPVVRHGRASASLLDTNCPGGATRPRRSVAATSIPSSVSGHLLRRRG